QLPQRGDVGVAEPGVDLGGYGAEILGKRVRGNERFRDRGHRPGEVARQLRQRGDLLGNVEAAVRGETVEKDVGEPLPGRAAARRPIAHQVASPTTRITDATCRTVPISDSGSRAFA